MSKLIYSVIGILFIGGVAWLIMTPGKPSKYDGFAQCVRDTKTVTFFGAFWCPHCQSQKALFGKSSKFLPYVECSTPDSRGQLKVCIDAGIKTYPTWEFATSSLVASTTRVTGEIGLVELSEKTGCKLPE